MRANSLDTDAQNESLFFKDFAVAWMKLQENGVAALEKPWWKFWA